MGQDVADGRPSRAARDRLVSDQDLAPSSCRGLRRRVRPLPSAQGDDVIGKPLHLQPDSPDHRPLPRPSHRHKHRCLGLSTASLHCSDDRHRGCSHCQPDLDLLHRQGLLEGANRPSDRVHGVHRRPHLSLLRRAVWLRVAWLPAGTSGNCGRTLDLSGRDTAKDPVAVGCVRPARSGFHSHAPLVIGFHGGDAWVHGVVRRRSKDRQLAEAGLGDWYRCGVRPRVDVDREPGIADLRRQSVGQAILELPVWRWKRSSTVLHHIPRSTGLGADLLHHRPARARSSGRVRGVDRLQGMAQWGGPDLGGGRWSDLSRDLDRPPRPWHQRGREPCLWIHNGVGGAAAGDLLAETLRVEDSGSGALCSRRCPDRHVWLHGRNLLLPALPDPLLCGRTWSGRLV